MRFRSPDRSLAFVFAHPDDETFATGGTIARYAADGVRCDLFCATDGDAGKSSGVPVSSRAELGALRRNELLVAARHLGVREVAFAGREDGALAQADADALIEEIVGFLRAHRPRVVVTFGPEGAPTGHRDHRAISRAATAAFFLAGVRTAAPDRGAPHAPSRLYYVTWDPPAPGAELGPDALHRPAALHRRATGSRATGQLEGLPATARLDVRAHLATKHDAFRAHVTQRQHEHRFTELALFDEELYALAAGVAQPHAVVSCLFEGIDRQH